MEKPNKKFNEEKTNWLRWHLTWYYDRINKKKKLAKKINTLIKENADPNVTSSHEFGLHSALQWAAFNGYIKTIRILLDYKANINLQDSNKLTPLMVAIGSRVTEIKVKIKVIKLLLKRGADPNLADIENVTPILVAYFLCNESVCNLLFSYGANPTVLSQKKYRNNFIQKIL